MFLTAVFVALMAIVIAILVVHRGPGSLHTVELSMRDYTFNGTNPVLRFRVGDRVRFVVRNEEETMIRHNFAIPDLGIPCDKEILPGEIRHVILTMKRPGTFEYVCCTHRGMGGRILVRR